MSELMLKSKVETETWARGFAKSLGRPTVILLDGDLGAGKTQVTRWILNELGVRQTASPTFAIHHEYPCAQGEIDHVDLYRIKSIDDLESSGFWDLLKKPRGLLFVEWAARLPEDIWPREWPRWSIHLSKLQNVDEGRIVKVRQA